MPKARKKVVVVGDGACGKTTMLSVFHGNAFDPEYIPTIFENSVAQLEVDGHPEELTLWDTAGQEDYDRLRPHSYHEADVVLVCFSVDNRDSYDNVADKWIPEVLHFCGDVPFVIVGLKADLRTGGADGGGQEQAQSGQNDGSSKGASLSAADGEALAAKYHVPYRECSAKLNQGVLEVMQQATRQARDRKKKMCIVS